jgi:diadenosine tetraphosphate (Ap4A) HIT family hydrolase
MKNDTARPLQCPFCDELEDVESSEFRKFFSREMLSSRIIKSVQNFVALPGLGAIRPGYVLILPKVHVRSFAFLDQPIIEELEQLKKELVQLITRKLSNVIVCEHGPVEITSSAGSCIDHAHLHIFPTEIDLFPRLSQLFRYRAIKSIHELSYFRLSQRPYIYYEKDNRCFSFEVDRDIPSQYIRKILWEEEGKPDEWDWGVSVGYEQIIDTVRILRDAIIV